MEGNREPRKLRESCVRRQFEADRLEEVVWARAYEEVWPILRRAVRQIQSSDEERAERTVRIAAGA